MLAFELKAGRRTALGWLAALVAVTLMMMALYPAVKTALSDPTLIKNLGSVYQMFGIMFEKIGTPEGYYSTMTYLYVSVCFTIQAIMLGMRVVHKEWRDKTCDFLFSKPKARMSIFGAKLSATAILLVATNVLYFAITIPMNAAISGKFVLTAYLYLAVATLFLQFIFWAIGILIGIVFDKLKLVLPVSLGIVFAFFALRMIESSSGGVTFISYLTPFKYINSTDVGLYSRFEPKFIVLGLCVAFVCLIAGAVIYDRKDIPTV